MSELSARNNRAFAWSRWTGSTPGNGSIISARAAQGRAALAHLPHRAQRRGAGQQRARKARPAPAGRRQGTGAAGAWPSRPRPSPETGLVQALATRILYEDAALLVVDKPSGLAVHGGSGLSLGLIEALRAMRPDCRSLELVHRLDRDTSGCVMIAKRSMLRHLPRGAARGPRSPRPISPWCRDAGRSGSRG